MAFTHAIILKRKRKLLALLLLSFGCLVTVNVPGLFLIVPWASLQCVIVVFPVHTLLLFMLFSWCSIIPLNIFQQKGMAIINWFSRFNVFMTNVCIFKVMCMQYCTLKERLNTKRANFVWVCLLSKMHKSI